MQPLWGLAGAIIFLYPLATKIVYSLCPWHQSLSCMYPLGAKVFLLITLPGAIDRETANAPEPVFVGYLMLYQMVSL